jgi:hypothetical protein
VIEAAYRALMKKHHPDVLVREPVSRQSEAAEINRAFQVLRDPERRAQYDSHEQARQDALRVAMQSPDLRQMQFQPLQPPRRSKSRAFLLIAALTALIVYVWQRTEGAERAEFGSAIPIQAAGVKDQILQATGISSAFPPVNPLNIDRAIAESRRINEKMGLMGLSSYSQDCFASQSRSAKLAELDFCVAFDSVAATYGADSAHLYSLPQLPRFEAREMTLRHLNAAKGVSDDEAWVAGRLTQVREMTIARLAPKNAPRPVETPVAAPPRERPKVATAERPTARQAAPRPAPPRQKRPTDADFLERQGYIY